MILRSMKIAQGDVTDKDKSKYSKIQNVWNHTMSSEEVVLPPTGQGAAVTSTSQGAVVTLSSQGAEVGATLPPNEHDIYSAVAPVLVPPNCKYPATVVK